MTKELKRINNSKNKPERFTSKEEYLYWSQRLTEEDHKWIDLFTDVSNPDLCGKAFSCTKAVYGKASTVRAQRMHARLKPFILWIAEEGGISEATVKLKLAALMTAKKTMILNRNGDTAVVEDSATQLAAVKLACSILGIDGTAASKSQQETQGLLPQGHPQILLPGPNRELTVDEWMQLSEEMTKAIQDKKSKDEAVNAEVID